MVEVDQANRERKAVGLGACQQNWQLGFDEAAIAKPGQRISESHLPETLAIAPGLGGLEDRLEGARVGLALLCTQGVVGFVEGDVLLKCSLELSLGGIDAGLLLERLDPDGFDAPLFTE